MIAKDVALDMELEASHMDLLDEIKRAREVQVALAFHSKSGLLQ